MTTAHVYQVSREAVTDFEPSPGWYVGWEREEDGAVLIQGPFETNREARRWVRNYL